MYCIRSASNSQQPLIFINCTLYVLTTHIVSQKRYPSDFSQTVSSFFMLLIMCVAYDVCRLIMFVAYDVSHLIMFVAYDVSHLIMFVDCISSLSSTKTTHFNSKIKIGQLCKNTRELYWSISY